MSSFAAGSRALGICDRCGFTYQLKELKEEIVNQHGTDLLVCPECFDSDHPQLQLGKYDFSDPQALRNPRVDLNREESNSLSGFNPVNSIGINILLSKVFPS